MKQSDIFEIINCLSFRTRVQYCLTKCSMGIATEAEDIPKHSKRIKLFHRILSNSIDLSPFILLLLTHKDISVLDNPLEVEDSKLESVVAELMPNLLFLNPE